MREVCPCIVAQLELTDYPPNFINLINELFGPERRLGRLKEFTHHFAGNYKFGHQLSSRIQGSKSMEEAGERAALFFENNSF